jgi:hypothetical protein
MSASSPYSSLKRKSPKDVRQDLARLRKAENTVYTYIKKPIRSTAIKVIKIEIFDADKIDNSEQMCKCNAELCVQYAVKNILSDEVYHSTKDLIDKVATPLSRDTCNGYTIL